jgi:hypothetical protein
MATSTSPKGHKDRGMDGMVAKHGSEDRFQTGYEMTA